MWLFLLLAICLHRLYYLGAVNNHPRGSLLSFELDLDETVIVRDGFSDLTKRYSNDILDAESSFIQKLYQCMNFWTISHGDFEQLCKLLVVICLMFSHTRPKSKKLSFSIDNETLAHHLEYLPCVLVYARFKIYSKPKAVD